jgi:MFS family permease
LTSLHSGVRPRTPLGNDFYKLWLANAVSNVGDGVTMVASPLLVASLTDDPGLVAGAAFVSQLPWLLFALISGAYVDRWDRRRVIITVNTARFAILALLAVAVWSGAVTIALIYLAAFGLGTLETLADTASQAILPAIVADEQLERANSRLMATFVLGNQLAAKPLGAYLFVLGAAVPFGVDALTFLLAALLLSALRWRPAPAEPVPAAGRSLRAEIGEGVRRLWSRPILRLMALLLCVGNVLFCAAFAAFVLYTAQRLGLDEIGFGVLLSIWAVGGLLGTVLAPRLRERFGSGALLRIGLLIEVATHVTLAVTRTPWVAALILILFGVHTMVWGVLIMSLRQRLIPDELRGRIGSVFALMDLGGAAVGTLLGGLIARTAGLTTPYWLAGIGMAVLTAMVWRRLTDEALRPPQPATE